MSVTVRKATDFDVPFLQAELAKLSKWEQVDLSKSLIWIAENDGRPFMMASLRLIWQLEPILKFNAKGVPRNAQRRGMWLLYKSVEDWLFDPKQNKTGIYWMVAVTQIRKVYEWAKVMGWHRCWKGGWKMVRWPGSEKFQCPNDCCKKKVPERLQEVVQEASDDSNHEKPNI